MKLNLSADDVLTSTRAVRKRLDLTRPVEREVIMECLEIAQQAPTGSNRQSWQWVFITDPAKKKAIADYYRANFNEYAKRPSAEYAPADTRTQRKAAVNESAVYLAKHFHEVPVLLIPCVQNRFDDLPSAATASTWGSILPAVWSFMLALRERGLGSAWTTIHLPYEREVAELLGIPYDGWTQVGLFPVAYTIGTDFKAAARLPADDTVHWDTW